MRGKRSRFAWMAVLLPALACAAGAQEAPPAGPPPGVEEKLGQMAALDVTLVDERGNPVVLRDLVDKPTILTLNFFRCAGICTPLLNGLVDTVSRMDLPPGKSYQIITVSFDPTDTPEVAFLKRENYIKQIRKPFPEAAWRFLTGDAASTKKLCDSVGFYFRPDGDQFIHAAAIMVLSPQGKIARYLYGITYLPFDTKMALLEASQGRVGPTINRALLFCFSYDPGGRKYVLDVTRIAGVVTLVLVLAFILFLVLKRRKIDEEKGSP